MSHYRSRLSELERDINQPRESSGSFFKGNIVYVMVCALVLLLLVVWTPSFLYHPKQKKSPPQKAWLKLILAWLVVSAAIVGALYFFM